MLRTVRQPLPCVGSEEPVSPAPHTQRACSPRSQTSRWSSERRCNRRGETEPFTWLYVLRGGPRSRTRTQSHELSHEHGGPLRVRGSSPWWCGASPSRTWECFQVVVMGAETGFTSPIGSTPERALRATQRPWKQTQIQRQILACHFNTLSI